MPKAVSRAVGSDAAQFAAAPVGRTLLWVALMGVWLFTLASFLSFDPADPPTHLVWPANAPAANWCGPAGAAVAYYGLKFIGWGVWVPLAASGLFLALMAIGRRVEHLMVRIIGVLMLAAAVAALQALLLPGAGPFPGLAGGLIGSVSVAELALRFSTLGTLVWVGLVAAVGAVVAFDQWTLLAPAWLFRTLRPVAAKAGVAAGETAGSAARATGGLVAALSNMLKGAKPVGIRLTDLEEDQAPAKAAAKLKGRKARGASGSASSGRRLKETAGGVGGIETFDPEAELAPEPLDEVEEDEIEEAGEADDAAEEEIERDDDEPKGFDPDELRQKIARLPIRFAAAERKVATEQDLRDLQGVTELEGYRFPGLDLLEAPEENFTARLEEIVREQAEALEAALQQYKIDGEVVGIESGPVITLYDVRLAPGTKVAQITAIASDVARALKAVNIRIVPNMVGRDTIGVEVPNPTKEKVRLKELMSQNEVSAKMKLPMFLGKDASGEPLIADLATMPHMLIAGTTGSGKSVAINTIIMGFLYAKKPNELKLVMVDPKMVELSQFKDIPHLMCPVVTDMAKAAAILEWATTKMDERYELLAEAGCRDITGYNELPWEELRERFNPATPQEEARIPRKLPYMVFIIDELADLMMMAKEVEGSIIRIAQKARAVGIHLILATQRPQANVVTGLIKSNMPCRICFKVASGMDSRIVLDQKGGELLLGQGDMLYLSPRTSKLARAQGTLVDDQEIRRVVKFMREVAKPTFERQLLAIRTGGDDEEKVLESENNSSASLAAAQEDPMFDRAVEIVLETKRGSVSLLQRRLAIGYTRASRLIDLMGIAGILGEHKGSVAREVAISLEEWEAMKRLHAEELARTGGNGAAGAPKQAPLFPDDPPPAFPAAGTPGVVGDDEDPFESHAFADEREDDDGPRERAPF